MNNSLSWWKFVGKVHPKATIVILCHCGEPARPLTDSIAGTEFICKHHGVIAFAAAGARLNENALSYVRLE